MSVFQEIKCRVNIVDACRMYGVDLNRANKAVCPFHNEDTASFSVSEKKQIWRCFGCGEGGDVISLVAKLHRCTPLEAAKRLDSDFHLYLFDTHPSKEKKSIWQMRKRSRDEFRQWQDYTYGVLADWRRKLFMEEKDVSYADYLLDSLMEDPRGFRLVYGADFVIPFYDDSFLAFSSATFERLIFMDWR